MRINERSASKHQNVFPHVPLSCNLLLIFVPSHSTSYQQKINIGKADKLKELFQKALLFWLPEVFPFSLAAKVMRKKMCVIKSTGCLLRIL